MGCKSVRAAGGVVVRKRGNYWEVLLVRKRDSGRWTLPKGHVDEGESENEASTREVWEETGWEAEICQPIGEISYDYQKNGVKCQENVCFFLMYPQKNEEQWDKKEISDVSWFPFHEAHEKIVFPNERNILQEGRRVLCEKGV